MLTALGFRVWYDMNDMGWDLDKSMREGVGKSKVFICCFNRTYETRVNCKLELDECKTRYPDKVVISLLIDDIFGSTWSVKQEFEDKLQFKTKMFCDIHKVAAHPAWNDPNVKDCIPADLLKDLREALQSLVKTLAGARCTPSFKSSNNKGGGGSV